MLHALIPESGLKQRMTGSVFALLKDMLALAFSCAAIRHGRVKCGTPAKYSQIVNAS